jgi:hypothetical protein
MTARGHLTTLAAGIAVALLAMLGPIATTASAGGGLVLGYFELEGTHGYEIEAGWVQEGILPPTASVTAHHEGLRATYETTGDLGPGVHASFGPVGSVAVGFHRQKRQVDRPEKGCVWINETGLFHGRFSFTGEGGYTAAEATTAPGTIVRLPDGFCGFGDDRKGKQPDPDFLRSTKLAARSRTANGYLSFETVAIGFASRVQFRAEAHESTGPVTITRTASVSTPEKDGSFLLGQGQRPTSAAVHPPRPFAGSARFRDPAGAPPSWTGSLRISLPGAPVVALAGPGFDARICLRTSLLRKCKVPLPAEGAP